MLPGSCWWYCFHHAVSSSWTQRGNFPPAKIPRATTLLSNRFVRHISPCGPSWPCLLGATSSGQGHRGLSCLQFMFFSFHFFLPIILSYYNFFVSYFCKVVSILFGNSVKGTEINDLLIKIIAWLFLTLNIRLLRKQIHPKQGDN